MLTGLGRLDDPDHYLTLAGSLAEGRGFSLDGRPTAYRPPLYPIILAPLAGTLGRSAMPWGVGALHLALGTGTVLLTGWTARRLGLSAGRSLAASAIVALDPVLAFQSRSVMTETPAAFLVAATLAGLTLPGLRGPILGGLGFGLASLCRPSLLPCSLLTAMAALVVGPGPSRARVGRASLLLVATFATLGPWAWRNARVLGEPVWTTTHGGYTLALANNPVYYADVLDGPPGAVWSGPNQARWFAEVGRSTAGMTEPEADRVLRDSALGTLRERPSTFLRASAARLGRFWGLAPSGAVYPGWLRLGSAAWTAPLWVALAFGLARGPIRRWPGVAAPSILVALTMVHLAYWTDLRMRAPLVPAIAVIAAGAGTPKTPGRQDDRA
jgi:Dolichyl-phosphate-mannose-protein mannosyltransferase